MSLRLRGRQGALCAFLWLLGTGCGDSDAPGGAAGEPPPVPVATIGELLEPFDADLADLEGPTGWSTQYGKSPEIIAMARGRVIHVLAQNYEGGTYKSHAHALRLEPSGAGYVVTAVLEPLMLDRIMGFVVNENDRLFVASGIDETDTLTLTSPAPGQYRSGIVRIVKQTWDGTVELDIDLDMARQATGESPELLINPMVAATSRLAVGGGRMALVHGINTDTDTSIQARHQKAITTHLDAGTGEIVRTSSAWVSHSFDQRVFHDGDSFIEMHLGDAYPRDIVFAPVEPDMGPFSLLAIKGETGANNTFTRMGNAALIENDPEYGYLALFATEPNAATDAMVTASRELGIVRVRRDLASAPPEGGHLDAALPDTFDVTSGGAARQNRLRWLTHYQAETGGQSHAERPKLVAVGDDTYVVLWERWDDGGVHFAGTWGMVIDATGAELVPPAYLALTHLPRGDDAFTLGNEAAWLTGDSADKQLRLHVVDKTLAYRRIDVE